MLKSSSVWKRPGGHDIFAWTLLHFVVSFFLPSFPPRFCSCFLFTSLHEILYDLPIPPILLRNLLLGPSSAESCAKTVSGGPNGCVVNLWNKIFASNAQYMRE